MATDNQDNENNTTAPSLSKRGAARRRVTRAGVGAVGLLSTLSAHATLSTKTMCMSPSTLAQSFGVQNSHITAPRCYGRTAAYWATAASMPGGCTRDTLFSTKFFVNPTGASCPSRTDSKTGQAVTNYQAGSFYCASFGDLLKGSQSCDSGTPKLGQEFVAAYLNISMNYIKGALSLSDLQNIWYELQMKGVYNATATVTWSPQQVADYLNKHINITG